MVYLSFLLISVTCGLGAAVPVVELMGAKVALAMLALIGAGPQARAMAPLYDPMVLNIGINCQWQQSCERKQRKAMTHAAQFIAAEHPPLWQIHLCNHNARRGPARVDWVGFDGCVRNSSLPQPQRRHRR